MTRLDLLKKVVKTVCQDGYEAAAEKVVRRILGRWGNAEPLYLRWDDVADSTKLEIPILKAPHVDRPDSRLSIGWIISVPGPGSGGHTTIFRLVRALEEAGHRCLLFVYDPAGGRVTDYEQLIRAWWPQVRAEIRSASAQLPDLDAYVATAWQTAHVLGRRSYMAGARFYLVQDYEPYFYPRGAAYELAEDSYRFGFRALTIGSMLAETLKQSFGTDAVALDFGCDTQVYSVTNEGVRSGVVFYAKPGVARRGYELGVAALAKFHQSRPFVPIHTFGISARNLPFPATVHSHLAPHDLNELYNTCTAGLSLSFTNVSLIPYELLAAGVVPVANDWDGCRQVLQNPHVVWARPTPDALAAALERSIDLHPAIGARNLSLSVRERGWDSAQRAVVREIERVCAPHSIGEAITS